jgi:hypothetical protein
LRRLSVVALALWLTSCAQIIDLEKREVDSADGGTRNEGGIPVAPGCEEYCALSSSLCNATNRGELFYTMEGCKGACVHYEPGDPANPGNSNTLSCRMNQLRNVQRFGEPATSCPGAGPGGGALDPADVTAGCGTNCEGYCRLYARVCSDTPIPDCLERCKALPERTTLTATEEFKSGDDTLQCRIAHVTAAAAGQLAGENAVRMTHCGHSGLKSSGPCDLSGGQTVKGEDYCRLVMTGCPGPLRVYENDLQCRNTFTALAPGSAMELLGDNVRCRRENLYQALTTTGLRDAHCSNAGPVPAACGAGKCDNYCRLVKKACPREHTTEFGGDDARCLASCAALPDRSQEFAYSVDAALTQGGKRLSCQILHLTRALADMTDSPFCEAAVGRGSCR